MTNQSRRLVIRIANLLDDNGDRLHDREIARLLIRLRPIDADSFRIMLDDAITLYPDFTLLAGDLDH